MNTLNSPNRAKDHRPKVISFRTILDGLNIAASQDILWPCHAFKISIPQTKKNRLNIFEETVLKLTAVESGDTKSIALLMCMEQELVAFIQNRLSQLDLLNERYELSESGLELLDVWQKKSDENLEYTVATVFIDLLSDKLLPYVSTENMSYKKILNIGDNGFIDFLRTPTNEKSRISARQIRPAKDSFWQKVPDANDIVRALREFKKRYKRHVLLNRDSDQRPPKVPMAEAISLQKNPELVYLHCRALIQTGNADLLVTDGFGFGFSESFANFLTSQDWPWVIDFKGKGVIDQLNLDETHKDVSCDNSANGFDKYPNIENPCRRAQKSLTKAKDVDIHSSHDEQEFAKHMGEAVVALYEAIEWTLRFVVSDYPVSHWERLFSSQSYQENNKILCSFATKIGFDLSHHVETLLQVQPGKIKSIVQGASEMQPLLALAIAGAISAPDHPFHQLAVEDAGSISFISLLKKLRDPVIHGSTIKSSVSLEALENYYQRTIRLIRVLVPDIAENTPALKSKQGDDIDQIRLKARIDLDKALGLEFIQTVATSIREELIKVTILSQRVTMDNEQSQYYINLLASIMQLSLFEAIKDRGTSATNQACLRKEAMDKIVQYGFYSSTYAVPKAISTVNTEQLERAVDGSNTTLGAQLLAVFVIGTEAELTQLQRLAPNLIDLIANLILLRGHGNQQLADIERTKIESLKNDVFDIIKTIEGVF